MALNEAELTGSSVTEMLTKILDEVFEFDEGKAAGELDELIRKYTYTRIGNPVKITVPTLEPDIFLAVGETLQMNDKALQTL